MSETHTMGKGPIRPLPPIVAPEALVIEARANCAARVRDRGEHELAASYERGEQDLGWGLRHEINRLHGEQAAAAQQASGNA